MRASNVRVRTSRSSRSILAASEQPSISPEIRYLSGKARDTSSARSSRRRWSAWKSSFASPVGAAPSPVVLPVSWDSAADSVTASAVAVFFLALVFFSAISTIPGEGISARFEGRGLRGAALHQLPVGPIGGPYQRSGLDMGEAHRLADPRQLGELVGMHEPLDRQVPIGGPQVLADRQDVDVALDQVAHDRQDLRRLLAEPEHHAGLGHHARGPPTGASQELER